MSIFNKVFQLKEDASKTYKVIGVDISDEKHKYFLEAVEAGENNEKEIVKETKASLKEKYKEINKKG